MIKVVTTSDKREVLERIARDLLSKKLVACVQILGPMKSIYLWKGDIVEDEEYLCIMKTKDELSERVEEEIKRNHNYETPEIIVVKVDRSSKDYERWLEEELSSR